jgi:hypothetical protein
MEFSVEIGENEKHRIEVKRNWWTGRMSISVDSQPVITKSPYNPTTHVSLKLSHKYEFSVGDTEKHEVRIERIRPLLFAGFSSHTYRIFVDDRLTKEHQGY